jgi:hypothetical protein
MKRKNLYKYECDEGGYTVSPEKPPEGKDFWRRYRLIADEGKAITNGEIITQVVDVASYSGWRDCDLPEELKTETIDEGIQ